VVKLSKAQSRRRLEEASSKLFKVGTAVPLPSGMTVSMQVKIVKIAQDLQQMAQKLK
jgi:hypothetical protein